MLGLGRGILSWLIGSKINSSYLLLLCAVLALSYVWCVVVIW